MQKNFNQKFIIKSTQDKEFIISGYASVYNIADRDNDIILSGAFQNISSRDIKFLWQHDHNKPIGIIKTTKDEAYGLAIEAAINSKIESGREAIELIKQGAVSALSIGFNIISCDFNDVGQRVISAAELIEISIVSFPANNHAHINYIDNQNNTFENIKGKNMNSELTLKKFNKLEEEVNNIHSYLAKSESFQSEGTELKGLFTEYMRKGGVDSLVTKSLSGSSDEGEIFLVPTLYNKVLNLIHNASPMRQLASVETISTSALDIVIEDGKFICGWVGEADARNETGTPKLIQKRIVVHELYAQPKATQKLVDDSAIQIENWLIERLKDHFAKAENDAFINGDGNKKPKGILGVDHKIEVIDIDRDISVESLLDLINSLDEKYLANATFIMNRTILSQIQKLKDNTGRFIWQPSLSDSMKQSIFGIPVVCCAEMPTKGAAIAIGDFKAGYKIVDRSGISIIRDPYTDKPFIKFYAVKRVGGDVINPNAIRIAKFTA